ncbi:MAG: CPBP family intramembrane metalloprotease [Butyrivibrio sp.]|nr:CPBP family intramembrane metalloprotease [Acetatifactor muris]MCM1559223.1 CPBP family intramembrane metalloprotease [Butyrivibrio sp.]
MQELIAAKKHFSRMGWLYVAAVAIIYALQMGIGFLLRLIKPEWLYDMNMNLLFSMAPMYLVAFPLLGLMLKKCVPGERIEKRKMTAGQYTLSAIICIGLAYAANIVGVIITTIIGLFTGNPVENAVAGVVNSISPWAVLFYTVLCAPIMEEFVFRKLIVDRAARYGQGVAVVISGLMFGLFHGNLNQFLYAAVIGMFFAYLYVKTGNLKITISLHMLFNFIGGFLPTVLMRKIDIESYMVFAENGSASGIVELMRYKFGWFMLYGLLLLFVISMLITGIVLFIVFAAKRKFVFSPGQTSVPKELKLSIALGNTGMAAFMLFWIISIVAQLFG